MPTAFPFAFPCCAPRFTRVPTLAPRGATMTSSTPRPDVVALLRACKELPDEDVHRLVLADWLEEHAHDPAEIGLRDLIRSQVEMDALPGDDARRLPLAARASALLSRHGTAWLGSLN